MDTLVSLALWNGIFLSLGSFGAWFCRSEFNGKWFVISLLLFNLNVALVLDMLGINGMISNLFGGEDLQFNWVGKATALTASLVILTSRLVPAEEAGISLRQSQDAKWGWWLVAFMLALSILVGWLVPDEPQTAEAIAYQLTMPSLEEELFYRGILLYGLVQTFGEGKRFPAAKFGFAALVSTIMFTVIHGLFWGEAGLVVSYEALVFAGVFAVLLMWLRLNTGNIIAAIVLHSIVNTVWRLV